MSQKPMYKQVVHTWMYQGMDLEKVMESLQKIGADGMDVTMRPEMNTAPEALLAWDVQAKLKAYGLTAPCGTISGGWPRDYGNVDDKIRNDTIEFSKRCVDAAVHIGADRMLVSPSPIMYGAKYSTTRKEDWARAVTSLREVGEYAQKQKVMLLIEPINRYGVLLVHTVGEALQMIGDIGLDNIHIVPDAFHMHFEEEKGIVNALYEGGQHIKCLHIGDNTRRDAGHGTIDWRGIIAALDAIGFDGPLSHEPVYNGFEENPFATNPAAFAAFEKELQQGIEYLRMIQEYLGHSPEALYTNI